MDSEPTISNSEPSSSDARDLLKGLANSRAITEVFLNHSAKISTQSIARLSTCPNLKELVLTHLNLDDAMINAMKDLTQVKLLSINGTTLNSWATSLVHGVSQPCEAVKVCVVGAHCMRPIFTWAHAMRPYAAILYCL